MVRGVATRLSRACLMLSFRLCGAFPLPDRLGPIPACEAGVRALATCCFMIAKATSSPREVARLQLEAEAGEAATKLGGVTAALIQEPKALWPSAFPGAAGRGSPAR